MNNCADGWEDDYKGVSLNLFNNTLNHCTLYPQAIPIIYSILIALAFLVFCLLVFILINIYKGDPDNKGRKQKNQNKSLFILMLFYVISTFLLAFGVFINIPIVSWIGFGLSIFIICIFTIINMLKFVTILDNKQFKGYNNKKKNQHAFRKTYDSNTKIRITTYSSVSLMFITTLCYFYQGYVSLGENGNKTDNIIAYQFGTILLFFALAMLFLTSYLTVQLFIKHIRAVQNKVKTFKSQASDSSMNSTNVNSGKIDPIDLLVMNLNKDLKGGIAVLPIGSLWIIHAIYLPVLSTFILPLHVMNSIMFVAFGFLNKNTPNYVKKKLIKTPLKILFIDFENNSNSKKVNNSNFLTTNIGSNNSNLPTNLSSRELSNNQSI